MSKHVLFAIHGMGFTKDDSWTNEVRKALEKAALQYKYFQNNKLFDEVEVVSVNYDNIIREVVDKWSKDSSEIDKLQKDSATQLPLDIVGWLKSANKTSNNFIWTHVGDVIVYWLLPLYRERIKVSVIRAIAERINSEIDATENASCSVLAHSLGTAIAHDAIHALGTAKWSKAQNGFGQDRWRFQSIFMISNVSRVLQDSPKAYDSIVKAGPIGDRKSYCSQYLNFRHELDLPARIKSFAPVNWSGYELIPVSHYRSADIHAIAHYLDNPRVHIPILRSLTSYYSISEKENREAIDSYSKFDGDISENNTNVQKTLGKIQSLMVSLGEDPEAAELIKGYATYFELLFKELKK